MCVHCADKVSLKNVNINNLKVHIIRTVPVYPIKRKIQFKFDIKSANQDNSIKFAQKIQPSVMIKQVNFH